MQHKARNRMNNHFVRSGGKLTYSNLRLGEGLLPTLKGISSIVQIRDNGAKAVTLMLYVQLKII